MTKFSEMKDSSIIRLVTKFRLPEVVAMETVVHSLFLFNDRYSAGDQAIVLKHFSLSLVLLNLKRTEDESPKPHDSIMK